jgi:hypothetical protein
MCRYPSSDDIEPEHAVENVGRVQYDFWDFSARTSRHREKGQRWPIDIFKLPLLFLWEFWWLVKVLAVNGYHSRRRFFPTMLVFPEIDGFFAVNAVQRGEAVNTCSGYNTFSLRRAVMAFDSACK